MSATRRTFLYTLSAAAPAAAQAPKDSVRLGFIGSGIRGKQLIDEFLEVPGAKGVAVADLYDGCRERAKEQLGEGIQAVRDYRAVLDNKDVDAVVIATPDHWHEKLVLDSLSAGKHVYIEKPMTWSIAEGPRIMAAAKRSGKVLQVGSQAKTSALTAKARELVASGALGKVNMIRMANHRNSAEGAWEYPVPPDASETTIDWPTWLGKAAKRPFDPKVVFQWRRFWDFSGGVAADLFVHQFTQMHEIMNAKAPVAAVSAGGTYKWKDGRTVPDVMNSLIEYGEGFIVDVYVNQANGLQPRGIFIYGDEGTLQVEYSRLTLIPEPKSGEAQAYGSLNFPKKMRDEYLAKYAGEKRAPRPEPKEIPVERGQIHNWFFIDSIVNNKPSRENAEEGHYAASAAHLCNLAYRHKTRASWDAATGKVKL
ncbi:MAG TPA: Gfo/Idh/MocA family oxidoreductase [Bryobacteraceae bacterium]|nr:Gfo/Idh/MocA family oxidoreductase [Bryobacteraceae bacterium]